MEASQHPTSQFPKRSKEELQRIMSPVPEHDEEIFEYWRTAPAEEHGRVLADLLTYAEHVNRYTGRVPSETTDFPGFRELLRRRELAE